MQQYIKGNFNKYIFKGETGYVIGLFKVKEVNDENMKQFLNHTITFTGYFHELNEGDIYLFYGKMVEHEKYGKQFQVDSYEQVLPEEKDSIVEFLCSGLFKGIGEKTAEKIVSYLGKETLNIILENPSNLNLIPGITGKQIDLLHKTLTDYQASYQTIVALNELGFNTKDSMAIYNKYKGKTTEIIRNNIYSIVDEVLNIVFKKVDGIALKNGIQKKDTRRVQASILYTMDEVCNLYGHSYLTIDEMYSYTIRCLGIEIIENEFLEAIENLEKDLKIIQKEEKYYLTKMYEAEENISKRCGYLMRCSSQTNKKLESAIREVETFFGHYYNEKQLEAIRLSYMKKFLIITGGPGTGKTTIIKAICELYRKMNQLSHEQLCDTIALLAPTGRASKRIAESTLMPACTIHRFLKWNKETNKFGINEYHKSNVDMVIIDEFSMVDTYLLDSLLKGLRYDTKIILVGDYHQLPSVGPGQLLKDMMESNVLNVIELKELYRQKENSNIISFAYQIQEDKLDTSIFNQQDDLTFIPVPSDSIREQVVEISKQYLKAGNEFQILAPMYKTYNGIDFINESLQDVFNPKANHKKEILINNVLFREEDKVIQLTNMPEENVFNGDIGTIREIRNGNKKEVYIEFDGNIVKYTASNFQKFKHAYAISIHKSQGSEFDTIMIPISHEYGKMLYQKLIYTAVTRAKKKLYVVGEIEALERAIHNHNSNIRRTSLKEMLIHNINSV